jgi:polyisoprenoid-binding protein YceI
MKKATLMTTLVCAMTMSVIAHAADTTDTTTDSNTTTTAPATDATHATVNTTHAHSAMKKPKKEGVPGQVHYNLDTAASSITWTAGHLAGDPHVGKVKFKDGHFEVNHGLITSGEANVEIKTLTDEDLKDPEYNNKLTTHLKSADFFDADKYPLATFKITSFSDVHNIVAGQPNAEVNGTLTIHGETQPVTVKMFWKESAEGFVATGKITLDRTKYGLKYNSTKFFDVKKLGDKAVKDNFDIDMKLVAKKM